MADERDKSADMNNDSSSSARGNNADTDFTEKLIEFREKLWAHYKLDERNPLEGIYMVKTNTDVGFGLIFTNQKAQPIELGVIDDRSIGWLGGVYSQVSDQLGRCWLRTRSQQETPASPNSLKIAALEQSIAEMNKNLIKMKDDTKELFKRIGDDQRSTAASLGRIANLLEHALPSAKTAATEQKI